MTAHRLIAVVLPKREARGACSCGDSVVISDGRGADLSAWHRRHVSAASQEPATTDGSDSDGR